MTEDVYQRARELDFDRTMAAAFAKAPASLFAVIAFQGELGAIRAKVTDPITFEIRHLWWREAIEAVEKGEVRKHPVVEALGPAIRGGEADPKALTQMVEARFGEFSQTAKDFETFIDARRTFLAPFFAATLKTLGKDEREGELDAFLAFDVLGCLRNLAFYRQKGIHPFQGRVNGETIARLLEPKPKNPYFKGLRALGEWHFKRQEKAGFEPKPERDPETHPTKILKLWASRWR